MEAETEKDKEIQELDFHGRIRWLAANLGTASNQAGIYNPPTARRRAHRRQPCPLTLLRRSACLLAGCPLALVELTLPRRDAALVLRPNRGRLVAPDRKT